MNVLEAIWTTMGNNTLEICTNNATRILKLLKKQEIPIIRGANQPLSHKLNFIADVHGKDGLGNTNLPLPHPSTIHWEDLDFIISLFDKNPREISIVSIGPLTNLAKLIQKCPAAILRQIKEIIIMGGAVTVPGNITPYAEFNIYCDPHAANIVLNSGLSITLVGLDVTHKVILTANQIMKIRARNTPLTEFIAKISHYYSKFHANFNGCYLHDPLAAAVALDPSLVTKTIQKIHVSEEGSTIGQTISYNPSKNSQILVCVEVDNERFLTFFTKTLLI